MDFLNESRSPQDLAGWTLSENNWSLPTAGYANHPESMLELHSDSGDISAFLSPPSNIAELRRHSAQLVDIVYPNGLTFPMYYYPPCPINFRQIDNTEVRISQQFMGDSFFDSTTPPLLSPSVVSPSPVITDDRQPTTAPLQKESTNLVNTASTSRKSKAVVILEKEFEKKQYLTRFCAQKVAEETGVSRKDVVRWFQLKRIVTGNKRPVIRKLPAEQSAALTAEFEKDRHLTRQRAEELSSRLGLRPLKIRAWFVGARRRTSTSTRNHKQFTLDKRSILIKAFEKNKSPTTQQMTRLAKKLKTTQKAVRKWFRDRRYRAKGDGEMKKPLIRYSPSQRKLLLEQFKRSPYPPRPRIEELASLLNTSAIKISNWFNLERGRRNRRTLMNAKRRQRAT